MFFQTYEYFIFIIIVFSLYWTLSCRGQNFFLLISSYIFYGFVHPWFLSLIFASTVTDYFCGLSMERHPKRKKLFLLLSLLVNLGLLGTFKYFDFFVSNMNVLLGSVGMSSSLPLLKLVLPVGISFYTFQTLSYTIDIYRGKLAARKSFLDFALFVAFFPQLVAGPIERASRLLPQVESERRFHWERFHSAIALILWGVFKKMVIADNVASVADRIFALEDREFFMLWVGVYAFAFQIYADFSAYTDIARGSARLLGFELMENFRHPYLAKSPVDFWRRWHISLSTWFRDYVYIPLGGSRATLRRTQFNLFATFVLSGLWHGASWNFLLWGAYHGALVMVSHVYESSKLLFPALPLLVKQIATFLLVLIGWFLFRERDPGFIVSGFLLSPFDVSAESFSIAVYLFLTTTLYSIPLWAHALVDRLRQEQVEGFAIPSVPILLGRTALVSLLPLLILLFYSQRQSEFIYFQF